MREREVGSARGYLSLDEMTVHGTNQSRVTSLVQPQALPGYKA